jgi:hypothetical protein
VASTLTQDLTQDRTTTERAPGGPGVRRAWRIVGSLGVALLLIYGVYQAVVGLAHEEYTFERSFDAEGIAVVEVDHNAEGSIRIVGADTDTISVTAHVDDGLRRTGHNERVDGDRLVLDSSCPMFGSVFCRVSYSLEVPHGVEVVATTNNGRVTVTDIDGDVEARSDNGQVELARIGGTIRADGDNGSLVLVELTSADVEASSDNGRVELQFDEPPQRVVADSDNGSVEVVVPDDDRPYLLDTDTDNGSVQESVAHDPSSTRLIQATTDNGDVVVRYG